MKKKVITYIHKRLQKFSLDLYVKFLKGLYLLVIDIILYERAYMNSNLKYQFVNFTLLLHITILPKSKNLNVNHIKNANII